MKNFIFYTSVFVFIAISLSGIFCNAQVLGDYRSAATGNWGTLATWQTYDGASWIAATATPTSVNAQTITIQSPHTVTRNAAVTVDQVVIDPGATVLSNGANILTIANGAGVDLTINGTFIESTTAANQNVWNAGATWQMGANGTLIKTTAASSNNWQTTYQGGIANIPATSNWIIRRNTAVAVSLSTTTPATGSVYPNLTIENNVAGIWVTTTASGFTGSAIYPTIKGNLDIGGTGTSTVSFLNDVQNATATQILGNVNVRTGNIIRNFGTGLEIKGNLTVAGTVDYTGGTGAKRIIFSGGNAQSVSGAGTLNVYDMIINKSADQLTMNRAVTVNNLMTFTNGIVNTTAVNLLTINTAGSVSGASNSSFVNGPVRYIGGSAFTYPVGKGADYQPLAISSTAVGGAFWTETFSNGCSASCLAQSYTTGPNGAWTVTTSYPDEGCGVADYPNIWYISGAECGNAAGACGTSCGTTDPSLHIGSTSMGDMGASYDAGGYCAFLGSPGTQSDTRSESPSINCTGRSNITLAFNYIENGSGTLDNATVWYYNGTVWAQLSDPAKTLWGSCSPQGLWTAYSIALPASADNNPSVKIGFRWINNDDMTGSDPSFAVDDITLSTTGPTVDFTCEYFYADPTTTFNNVMGAGLAQIENCEYWILTRNAGTASKNVTPGWDANSCILPPATLTDYRVARWDGASWQNEGNTATTGAVPPASGTVTSGSVSSFSPFTIGSVTTWSLPVELLSFTAKVNGKSVDLNWSVASEINNDYYTIERSRDAIRFENILTVDGEGNSSKLLNYYAIDKDPFDGISYYRLKQTDFDGKYSYSEIIALNITNESTLEIISINYETDNNNSTIIRVGDNSSFTLELLNNTGGLVFSSEYNFPAGSIAEIFLNSNDYKKGMYLLKVSDKSVMKTKKLIIF